VDHETRVALVDAHAEGVGRDHDAPLVVHEQVLVGAALGARQLAVVDRDRFARFFQDAVHFLGRLDGGRVDDADAFGLGHQAPRLGNFWSGLVTCTTL
jgi:hypothetical protein